MRESNFTLGVVVEPGRCWGSIIGEDSDQGACRLCVDTCPEMFQKPLANQCACVRPGVDLGRFIAQILQAVEACPVNAIRLLGDKGAPRCSGSRNLWQ